MRIDRNAMQDALAAFVKGGHGLLVGAPGAGKTFGLQTLIRRWTAEQIPVLPVAVEDIGEATEQDLKAALGYASDSFEHALREEVTATASRGVIVFDGFDAARSTDTRSNVLRLIRTALHVVPANWSVLVSVRNYDARRSSDLQRDFRSEASPAPAEFRLADVQARHFFVPPLTPSEIASAAMSIEGLPSLIHHPSVSAEFLALLEVPFNLWLVEQLLRSRVEVGQLEALRSEVELLERYWTTYVQKAVDATRRHEVLRRVAAALVERRRLNLRRSEIGLTAGDDATVASLLSAEVLREAGPAGTGLRFSHNILFDYAVSVLVIEDDWRAITAFLDADISRPLFLRPSLTFLFARLWSGDRELFWQVFWPLLATERPAVRLVGRIIPPLVMAQSARSVSDLVPLFKPLEGGDSPTAVLRALQAARFGNAHTSAVWIDFALLASERPNSRFAWELAGALKDAAELQVEGSPNVEKIASASQQLFTWCWKEREANERARRWLDRLNAIQIVPTVLKTLSARIPGGRAVVAKVIDVIDEPDVDLRLYYALASGIVELATAAPDLALRVYKRAFGHTETSTAPTDMGGAVLRLVGNRRQDFGMVLYSLARAFPSVFEAAPFDATIQVVDLLNEEAVRGHVRPYLKDGHDISELEERFQLDGRDCVYLQDRSAIWWDHTYGRDELQTIVEHVEQSLESSVAATRDEELFRAFSERAYAAVTWALLLRVAARAPARFAHLGRPLLTIPSILVGADTASAARRFAEAAAPLWSDGELNEVETAVMSLSSARSIDDADDMVTRARTRARDRMLVRLPRHRLSEHARKLAERASEQTTTTKDDESGFTFSVRSVSPEEALTADGIDLAQKANADLRALWEALQAQVEPWRNAVPPEESILAMEALASEALRILEPIASVAEAYRADASDDGVPEGTRLAESPHPRLVYDAWTGLVAVAETLARSRPQPGTGRFEMAKGILQRGRIFPVRLGPADADGEYRWASWSSSPRTEAIEGLAYLADASGDQELAHAVIAFARSPKTSERYLAIRYAPVFANRLPDSFEQLIHTVVPQETNEVVLGALLEGLWYFVHRGHKPLRDAVSTVRAVVDAHLGSDNSEFVAVAARWVVHLAVVLQEPWARDSIRVAAVEGRYLSRKRGEALGSRIVDHLLAYALPEASERNKAVGGATGSEEERRQLSDAMHLSAEILVASGDDARKTQEMLESRYPDSIAPEDDVDVVRLLARHGLVDAVAWRLRRSVEEGFSSADFERAVPLLDAVLEFAASAGAGRLTAPTTHHFVEFLNSVVDVDPARTVHYAARFVAAGAPEGYQLDSLAVTEVVQLVEKVLADHRGMVSSGQPLDDLLRLLDMFADHGWPQAMRLVWRLDEVYR